MVLTPLDNLTNDDIKRGMRYFILDGVMSQSMGTLTSGIFLVAFALQLGASNLIIGLLASIPPLTQLAQIPAVYGVEKFRNRRLLCVLSSIFSRLFLIFIVIIPFLINSITGFVALGMVLLTLFLQNIVGSVGGVAWNSWIRDLIPQENLGVSYSRRLLISLALSTPLSVIGGFIIDMYGTGPDGLKSYSLIFSVALAFGLLGLLFLSKIPEPRMPVETNKIPIMKLLEEPFKDKNYRELMIFLFIWTFAINLAAPFFTVYLLVGLGYGTLTVILLSLISLFFNLIFLQVWGKISDRFTNKAVLSFNGLLFLLTLLLWTFTTLPNKYFLTMPLIILIQILSGIANAGIVLSTLNIANKLSPHGHATSYLAANNFINSIAAGIAPLIGGYLADVLATSQFSVLLQWKSPSDNIATSIISFEHWDFLFIIAVLVGIYGLHRLSLIKEVGIVSENLNVFQMMSEVRREIRNLSTIGGLQQMNTFIIPHRRRNNHNNNNNENMVKT